MQFSDLHVHTRYSDGLLWPEQVIKIASNKKLKCLSITDHDTVDSQYFIADLASQYNVNIIPGLELSTEYRDREIHILAYFIDVHNGSLIEALNKTKQSRVERAKSIVSKLNSLDIQIDYEEVKNDSIVVGRPHIAKLLVNKGYANNTKEAFQQFLIKGKPAYVDRFKIEYRDALKLVAKCSGIAVLAHPGEIYKGISIEGLIKEFKVYGLRGIEVFHPAHTLKQTNDFYNLAKKYSLTITGGSDCHGGVNEAETLLGAYGIDENLSKKFLKLKYNK